MGALILLRSDMAGRLRSGLAIHSHIKACVTFTYQQINSQSSPAKLDKLDDVDVFAAGWPWKGHLSIVGPDGCKGASTFQIPRGKSRNIEGKFERDLHLGCETGLV
jgi:hypothetical protein